VHRIYLAVLFVLVAADFSAADELKQLWEFEYASPDQNDEACAYGFDGDNAIVLGRSSNIHQRNVVFSTRTISDDGTSTENTLAEWPAKKRCGRLFEYGVFPSVADPTTGEPGLIVAGRLVPGDIPVLQRFSDKGTLEWTEPLPVGPIFSCRHITAFDNGFLLAGRGCVSVDLVGQKRWVVSDKQRYRRAKKVVVLSDQSVVILSVPLAKLGKDLTPNLTVCSRNGEKLKEVSLSEIKIKPISAILGTQQIAWLAGPFKNDQIILAYAEPMNSDEKLPNVVTIYDSKLENSRVIQLDDFFDQWRGIISVGRLDNNRFYAIGGRHDKKMGIAICTLDGQVLCAAQVKVPDLCVDIKVWTDGESRLCMFLRTIIHDPFGFLQQGTLYGFRIVPE